MFNNLGQLETSKYTNYMLAQVVDNNDPERKQRIKVRIPLLLEGDAANLPWVLSMHPSHFGTGSGAAGAYGSVCIPPLDAWVVVRLEEGSIYYGQCVGATPVAGHELSLFDTNYPKRYGMVDPIGNHFYVDTTQGQATVQFRHMSGTQITIANNGAVTINGASTLNMSIAGTITSDAPTWNHNGPVNITGDVSITGNQTVSDNVTVGSNVTAGSAMTAGTSVTAPMVVGSTDVTFGGKSGKDHTHQETGDGGGTTGPPN